MLQHVLLQMAKDIAASATRVMVLAGAVFLFVVTIGAGATALGATTGLPTWALIIGRLMWACAAAWGAYTWFESAKKRAAKRNK